MAKVLVGSSRKSASPKPVEGDEIDREAMVEIIARVKRLRSGEEQTTGHEDFMRELGFGDDALPPD